LKRAGHGNESNAGAAVNEQKNWILRILAAHLDPLIDPPIRTASRLSMPLGEAMAARSSKTLCCKYFLYNKAHDTVTTTRQRIVAPAYLKVFLITVALQTSFPLDSTPGPHLCSTFRLPLCANHRTGI
jgi:hypothetical protein